MREVSWVSLGGLTYTLPQVNFETFFLESVRISNPHLALHYIPLTPREMPCLSGRDCVIYSANEKVPSMNPILVKCLGFFIACELREVECLRSLLLGTCILLAFSHFFMANEYKEIVWLH